MQKGKQSIQFEQAPYIVSTGNVVGKKEGEGPLGKQFDFIEEENLFDKDIFLKTVYETISSIEEVKYIQKYCIIFDLSWH